MIMLNTHSPIVRCWIVRGLRKNFSDSWIVQGLRKKFSDSWIVQGLRKIISIFQFRIVG